MERTDQKLNPDEAVGTARAAGDLAGRVTEAANPSASFARRAAQATAAVRIGTKLLPPTWRAIRRHPVVMPLVLVDALAVALVLLPRRSFPPIGS